MLVIFLLLNAVPWLTDATDKSESAQIRSNRNIKLPACQACKMLIDSFTRELEKSFQDQPSDSERDETKRNEEILKQVFANMCREDRAKDQCRALVDKCKGDIQVWWLNDKSETPDIIQYLCIDKLRYCCPSGRYGPECKPCPGYPDQVCSNNGKCKGNGTRKGSGQCSCDVGYAGAVCDQCTASYYLSYKDDNKMLCARCHASCDGNCSQAGAQGCEFCRDGWRKDKFKGCVDVNECLYKRPPCKRNEFCVNNEGSFSCLACDQACDTCTGDGPDMCEKCASGFVLKDNICVNEKSYVSYSDVTRYCTYGGLCFATYIVFQNSPWTASVIGICVAVYVTVSEYMLGTLNNANFVSFSKTLEGFENLWRS